MRYSTESIGVPHVRKFLIIRLFFLSVREIFPFDNIRNCFSPSKLYSTLLSSLYLIKTRSLPRNFLLHLSRNFLRLSLCEELGIRSGHQEFELVRSFSVSVDNVVRYDLDGV